MTNATLVTKIGLNICGSQIKTWCDNLTSIKSLSTKTTAATAGTIYSSFKTNNTVYQVPVSTNLRIFGIEYCQVIIDTATAFTTFQIGYSDDGTGTNFVSLADITDKINNLAPLTDYTVLSGFALGLLTVPAGKYPTIKSVGGTNGVFLIPMVGIETD